MANKKNQPHVLNTTIFLWLGVVALGVALLIARVVYSEYLWLTILICLGLLAVFFALIRQNQIDLKGRVAAYGINSIVTVLLVLGILSVANFLGSRYPYKLDLTKNKIHTLSDQSVKVFKGLQRPVKATYYCKLDQREQIRPLFDNYRALSPKFEVEYVDPTREPTRAQMAGVKKYGTLILTVGTRDNKVEEPTEEKVTNAVIKLLKDKTLQLCSIVGHGEKSFSGKDADGYSEAKKELEKQSYEVKELNLAQEAKIPDTCDMIALLGPTKAFFPPEIKAISDYLATGGRALIAVDVDLKGGINSPELEPVLLSWFVRRNNALIVDPLSRMFNVDASVPIIATFAKNNSITKEFSTQCFFPFASPLDLVPGNPPGLKVQWLAQSTPKSFAVFNMKEIAAGRVKADDPGNKKGPLNVAVAVDGKAKDSKATRNTRLVVFSTSMFANNNYSRYGGNMDFFLNAASWLMEDESLISIRAKEEGAGKIQLTAKTGQMIFLLTVIIIPLLISVSGVVIWALRRKL